MLEGYIEGKSDNLSDYLKVETSEDIEAIASLWRDLQTECHALTPFQTWEWNVAWWRQFRGQQRLRLLLFYQNSLLVGIAPLMIGSYLGMPLRCLRWIGTGHSDYLGPLIRRDFEQAVAYRLQQYLAEMRGWDFADLQHLRFDTPLTTGLPTEGSEESYERKLLPADPCPYLTLPAEWGHFTARLSRKFRSNLGYQERLLYRSFSDVTYRLADASTLDTDLTALFELHQRRWNARWLPGVLGSDRIQVFHREVARAFLKNGWLRLHMLSFDQKIQATLYCFALNRSTFYYLGGFALESQRYSPGTLVTAQAIRHSIGEGHTEFDFLRGNEPYKYRWQATPRHNRRLLLRHTPQGHLGFLLNTAERAIIRYAQQCLGH